MFTCVQIILQEFLEGSIIIEPTLLLKKLVLKFLLSRVGSLVSFAFLASLMSQTGGDG